MSRETEGKSLSIKGKLYIGVVLLCVLGAILGIIGMVGMNKALEGLNSVYENRVVPLRDLKTISDEYAIAVVDALHKVRDGGMTSASARSRLDEARTSIASHWKAYMSTELVSEEQRLVGLATPLMQRADALLVRIEQALANDRSSELDEIARRELYQTIDPVTDIIGQLTNIQLDAAQATYDTYKALGERLQWLVAISTVVLLALALLLASWFIRSNILRPLDEAMLFAQRIASADLSSDLRVHRNDEIGVLARALSEMKSQLRGLIELIGSNATKIAAFAEQLATTSSNIAEASEQQSKSASSMAAAVEEMTVSISHVASFATDARQLAEESGAASHDGGLAMTEVVGDIKRIAASVDDASQAVSQLGDHSREIASVVNVIKDVADQTNLLALNAAIEAARAGEQGRGFAVVADEVRKLAERTAVATQEIGKIIQLISSGTERAVTSMARQVEEVTAGVQVAGSAGEKVGRINESSERVMDAVAEISQALVEQSAASNDIAQNVERIATMGEQNSQAAQETAAATRNLAQLSVELQQIVARFRM